MAHPNLQDIKGIGVKRYEKIKAYMQEKNLSLADIYAMSVTELKENLALPISVAESIVAVVTETTEQAAPAPSNFTKEILNLAKTDDRYPRKLLSLLKDKSPEKLAVWGNLELLNKPAVGFCGSRNVSDKGLEVTADIAEQIAKLDWVVVSGHARGVDLAAHRAALENDAGTIIVLPQGFDDFKLNADLKKIAKKENLLIISEFESQSKWAVWRAMQRNHTIIALSDAMVLVESRTEGGTFNAGKAALQYKHPLFVVEFQEKESSNEGNAFFLQRGAIRLAKNRETGRANINQLKEQVEAKSKKEISSEKPTQLEMF